MRLALLATGFADYSFELASELARDHEVLLLAEAGALDRETSAAQLAAAPERLRIVRYRVGNQALTAGEVTVALSRLAAFRPQVIIAHEHGRRHVGVLQQAAKAFGPLLLIVHDPEPHAGRDAALAERRREVIAGQRRLATGLFAHGETCAAQLRAKVGGDVPVVAIPHGPILRPPEPPAPPSAGGGLLMFGRMEAYKGLDVLLEAMRRLSDAAPHLHLLGDGPELDRLGPALSALPSVTVEAGFASRDRLLAALAAADGVLAPYTEATQSGVVASAFANRRPMLASAVGGLGEVVCDGVNGRLAPPGDPAALAAALARFARDAPGLADGALATAEGPLAWRHAAEALGGFAKAHLRL